MKGYIHAIEILLSPIEVDASVLGAYGSDGKGYSSVQVFEWQA